VWRHLGIEWTGSEALTILTVDNWLFVDLVGSDTRGVMVGV